MNARIFPSLRWVGNLRPYVKMLFLIIWVYGFSIHVIQAQVDVEIEVILGISGEEDSESQDKGEVEIYPNPVRDYLKIIDHSQPEPYELLIRNQYGELLYRLELDAVRKFTVNLLPGYHYLQLRSEETTITRKFLLIGS